MAELVSRAAEERHASRQAGRWLPQEKPNRLQEDPRRHPRSPQSPKIPGSAREAHYHQEALHSAPENVIY
eukprot:4795926-Pyramimonas_sp.AAC.1